jgi:hypothetical protein
MRDGVLGIRLPMDLVTERRRVSVMESESDPDAVEEARRCKTWS